MIAVKKVAVFLITQAGRQAFLFSVAAVLHTSSSFIDIAMYVADYELGFELSKSFESDGVECRCVLSVVVGLFSYYIFSRSLWIQTGETA